VYGECSTFARSRFVLNIVIRAKKNGNARTIANGTTTR
jgi:hypothetical protein